MWHKQLIFLKKTTISVSLENKSSLHDFLKEKILKWWDVEHHHFTNMCVTFSYFSIIKEKKENYLQEYNTFTQCGALKQTLNQTWLIINLFSNSCSKETAFLKGPLFKSSLKHLTQEGWKVMQKIRMQMNPFHKSSVIQSSIIWT